MPEGTTQFQGATSSVSRGVRESSSSIGVSSQHPRFERRFARRSAIFRSVRTSTRYAVLTVSITAPIRIVAP